ncbi:MAG: hypothetical protein ACREBV_08220, partial [Candidatus Zixiibacteriota bacterium]
MKALIKSMIIGLAALVLVSCDENNTVVVFDPAPMAPQGIYTVTGNNAVYVYWNGPYEKDIDEYLIYRSDSATTGYAVIGSRDVVSNPNLDLITYEFVDFTAINGTTYYYA